MTPPCMLLESLQIHHQCRRLSATTQDEDGFTHADS